MEPKERPVAVIYWDVNQLKYVNDTFGHLYGDQLIAKIAGSIRAAVTSEETNAYRYGGDEFLMIIPDGTQEIAEDVIEKWRQVMKPRFRKTVRFRYLPPWDMLWENMKI